MSENGCRSVGDSRLIKLVTQAQLKIKGRTSKNSIWTSASNVALIKDIVDDTKNFSHLINRVVCTPIKSIYGG
jgi:hypothetical protein